MSSAPQTITLPDNYQMVLGRCLQADRSLTTDICVICTGIRLLQKSPLAEDLSKHLPQLAYANVCLPSIVCNHVNDTNRLAFKTLCRCASIFAAIVPRHALLAPFTTIPEMNDETAILEKARALASKMHNTSNPFEAVRRAVAPTFDTGAPAASPAAPPASPVP